MAREMHSDKAFRAIVTGVKENVNVTETYGPYATHSAAAGRATLAEKDLESRGFWVTRKNIEEATQWRPSYY